jgi:alanyl aminopeptidase
VRLTQQRALPVGPQGSSAQTWEIPLCFRYSSGGEIHRECTIMTGEAMEWKLKSKECPDWISANADGAGYYRVLYKGDLLRPLLADGGMQLTEAERAMFLSDMSALMEMGTVKASDALALVPVFARSERLQIVSTAVRIAGGIRNHLVPKELEANYVRFIQQSFGERARELGWQFKPEEDDDTRLLRARLAPFVADNGADAGLAAEARRLAERWIADRKALDPNIAQAILSTAAQHGDRVLFDRFLAAAKATQDRRERGYLLAALGQFREPSLARAGMDLLLGGAFDLREALSLLYGPMRYSATRGLPFQFVKANFDELLKRSPTEGTFNAGAAFPFTGSSFCDERSRADVDAFFAKRVERLEGGPRNLAKTLESIKLCEALAASQQASVAEFLRHY